MRLFVLLAVLVASLAATPALARQTVWIDDDLEVPMRSGQGYQYRILHGGVDTGTTLTLLAWPESSDWARVRYQGSVGWIEKQYLSRDPVAQVRLARLQREYKQIQEQLQKAQSRVEKLLQQRNQLRAENQHLQEALAKKKKRLQHLQKVASKPIKLSKANQRLRKKVNSLRTELDQVKAQNAMLRSNQTTQQWTVGAVILLLGGILGWLFKSRGGTRNRGNWMN